MPEEKYDYRASLESLTFAENLLHIRYAIDWYNQSLLGNRESRDWKTDTIFNITEKFKEEMIATIVISIN